MTWNTSKLPALGFRRVMTTPNGEAWIRMKMITANETEWAIGDCVLCLPGFATRIQCAFDMKLIRLEALGAIATNPAELAAMQRAIAYDPEIGGIGDVLKKFGKKFRDKVNKAAGAIAKAKILAKLRGAYAKVLEGPIGKLGAEVGARVLSAWGVPAAATRMAIRQRQLASADRLREGGWAGMVERATGKEGLKGLAKEVLQRNLEAGKGALRQALPGGLDLGKLAGNVNKAIAERQVSGEWR